MATLIASATLQINSFIGEPLYVVDDYVASGYVQGGELVAQDLDLATTLAIASSTITVRAVDIGESSPSISSTITTNAVATRIASVSTDITSNISATGVRGVLATALTIAGATMSVTGSRIRHFSATLPITSTINMGTNVFDIEVNPFNTFIVSQETRVNTIQRETRVKKVKQETRVFELA